MRIVLDLAVANPIPPVTMAITPTNMAIAKKEKWHLIRSSERYIEIDESYVINWEFNHYDQLECGIYVFDKDFSIKILR